MKMRKLFAGLAAAATLLGGLALGAGTANAVDVDNGSGNPNVVTTEAYFLFTGNDADQWTNRAVKYYKVADYVAYAGNGSTAVAYGVQTASTANREAIKTALEAAVEDSNPKLTVPTDDTTDLMAWALQNGALDSEGKPWNGSTRKFAESLANNNAVTGDTTNFKTVEWPNYESTGNPQQGQQRFTSLPAGVYLFVDTAENDTTGNIKDGTEQNSQDLTNAEGGKVVTQSAPIVLASGYVEDGVIKNAVQPKQPEDGTYAYNTVEFKNHVTPVSKVFGDKDGTVSTGQVVTYTLTSELPAYTTGFDNYQFSLTDTPGVGQTVDLTNIAVKVGEADINPYDGTSNQTGYELKYSTNVTADEQTTKKFDGDGTKQFIIDLSKYVQAMKYDANANRTVTVTYDVTINEQAKQSHEVPNTVEVNDNNSKATDKTKLTLGKFAFTKQDSFGNALKGAEFTITAVDTDATDKTDAVIPTDTDKVSTSNDEGVVAFDGLADGVYTVKETKVPTDFAQPFVAQFKVTISGGKATSFDGTDIFNLAPDSQNPTSDNANKTDYVVKNVRNITELPKTGAAGIAMFTVAGLLLAGAAALVFAKSRATKRALHA